MKKTILAVMLLAGAAIMAQEERKDHHRKAMRDLTPEQMATLQTKKMTLALDLTEAQQQQVQTLNLENAKLRKSKMEERQARKESGELQKPTSEERYSLQLERLDDQIAHKAQMKEILSQEQYEKWEKLHLHKKKHHKRKMPQDRKGRK